MKKGLIKVSTLAATTLLAATLASCTSVTSVKSYKKSVSADEFNTKFDQAMDDYITAREDKVGKFEGKSFFEENNSYTTTKFTDLSKNVTQTEKTFSEGGSNYDAANHIYSRQKIKDAKLKEDVVKHVYGSEDAKLVSIDKLNHCYNIADSTLDKANQNLESLAKKTFTSIDKFNTDLFYLSIDTYLFQEDEYKYFIDKTVYTIVGETTFESDSQYTGTGKIEVQITFDGADYVYSKRMNLDYTFTDNDTTIKTKSSYEESKIIKFKDKSVSYSFDSILNEEIHSAKTTDKSTISFDEISKVSKNAESKIKQKDVTIDTTIPADYYEKKTLAIK